MLKFCLNMLWNTLKITNAKFCSSLQNIREELMDKAMEELRGQCLGCEGCILGKNAHEARLWRR